MKKTLKVLCALALFATVPTMLVACDNATSSVENENQQIVNEALKGLTLASTVTSDFQLPSVGKGGVTFEWTSNNDAIKCEGNTAKVTQSTTEDVTVTLTVKATKENTTLTREFTVVVSKKVISAEYITVPEALSSATGTEITVRGVVAQILHTNSKAADASGFYIVSDEAALYCFGSSTAAKVERGDDVIIKGTTAAYPVALTFTTQITNIDLVDTVQKNANYTFDMTKHEVKTVAQINESTEAADYTSKVVTIKNARINKYEKYSSYSVYDWTDTPNYSTDKKINLYSASGNAGKEFAWLDEYLDKAVDLVFVVNSMNSKNAWRGAVLQVSLHQ